MAPCATSAGVASPELIQTARSRLKAFCASDSITSLAKDLPEVTLVSIFLSAVPPSASPGDGWSELDVVSIVRLVTEALISNSNPLLDGGCSCAVYGLLRFLASRFSSPAYSIAQLTTLIEQIDTILAPLFTRDPFWVDDGWVGGVLLFVWFAWRRLPPPPLAVEESEIETPDVEEEEKKPPHPLYNATMPLVGRLRACFPKKTSALTPVRLYWLFFEAGFLCHEYDIVPHAEIKAVLRQQSSLGQVFSSPRLEIAEAGFFAYCLYDDDHLRPQWPPKPLNRDNLSSPGALRLYQILYAWWFRSVEPNDGEVELLYQERRATINQAFDIPRSRILMQLLWTGAVSSDQELVKIILQCLDDKEKEEVLRAQDVSDNGRTLLHKTVRAERGNLGGVEIVKTLMHCPGFDPNVQSYAGSPLHSSRSGQLVRLLAQSGANLAAVTKKQRNSLLSTSCSAGYMDTITTLIDMGIDIDHQSINGNTPLIWAVLNGELEPVKYLLSKGASIDIKNSSGFGPIHWSVSNEAMLDIFLAMNGVDWKKYINTSTTDSPMHRCARLGTVAIMKKLVEAGGNVHLVDEENQRPVLMDAFMHNNYDVAKYLIPLIQDWTAVDSQGFTYLMAAAYTNAEIVAAVLEKDKSTINVRDSQNLTALSHACSSTTAAIVKLLIASGAETPVEPPSGLTPLHWAAMTSRDRSVEEQLELLQFLMDHTDCAMYLQTQDNRSRTPLVVALLEATPPIVQFFLTRGAKLTPDDLPVVTKAVSSFESYKMCFQYPQNAWIDEPSFRPSLNSLLLHVTNQRRLVFAKFLAARTQLVFVDTVPESRRFYERLLDSLAASPIQEIYVAQTLELDWAPSKEYEADPEGHVLRSMGEAGLWLLAYNPQDESTKCQFQRIVFVTPWKMLYRLPAMTIRLWEQQCLVNFTLRGLRESRYPQFPKSRYGVMVDAFVSPVVSSCWFRNQAFASVGSLAFDLLSALQQLSRRSIADLQQDTSAVYLGNNLAVHRFIVKARWIDEKDSEASFRQAVGELELKVLKELIWLLYSDEVIAWGMQAVSVHPEFALEWHSHTRKKAETSESLRTLNDVLIKYGQTNLAQFVAEELHRVNLPPNQSEASAPKAVSLSADLSQLGLADPTADFKIVFESHTFHVHKDLLRCRWRWFANMLDPQFKELREGCLDFKNNNVSLKALGAFLAYMSSGSLPTDLSPEDLQRLVALLDYTNFFSSPLEYIKHQPFVRHINLQPQV